MAANYGNPFFRTVEEELIDYKKQVQNLNELLVAEREVNHVLANDLVQIAHSEQVTNKEVVINRSDLGLQNDEKVTYIELKCRLRGTTYERRVGPFDTIILRDELGQYTSVTSTLINAARDAARPVRGQVWAIEGQPERLTTGEKTDTRVSNFRANFQRFDVGEQVEQFHLDRHLAREMRHTVEGGLRFYQRTFNTKDHSPALLPLPPRAQGAIRPRSHRQDWPQLPPIGGEDEAEMADAEDGAVVVVGMVRDGQEIPVQNGWH